MPRQKGEAFIDQVVESTDIFSNSFLEDLEKLVKLHRNLEQS